jgi:hemolysin III
MAATKPSPSEGVEEKLSLPLFVFTVVASLAGLALLVWLLAPRAVWLEQISASPIRFAAVFFAITLLNCFIEYFFHRYVLHKPVVRLLGHFYRQHTLHHSLTRIGRRRTPGGREVPYVENIFPITTPEQREASFFPWYTLVAFGVLITPLFAFLQWLAPAFPWFFSGFAALAGSLCLYEIFHAIEHWPFEKWAPLIEHPRFDALWRAVYSFHLRHHAVIDCNEAISGFFTLPVADWVFGTFVLPETLYADGGDWQAAEFSPSRPFALIRWCDAKADEIVQRRRAGSRTTVALPPEAAAPVAYTRGERIAHYLTHGAGLAASVASLVVLLVFACLRGSAWHIATFAVFGVSLVLVYATVAFMGPERRAHGRKLYDRYKHAALFLLIAGTATPFLLANTREAWGWSVFGIVWGLCLAGGGVKLWGHGRFQSVATAAYVLLGLLALIAAKPLIGIIPPGAIWLLLAGALLYAGGTVFNRLRRTPYRLVVRQVFAFGGSACHLIAVLLFLLPGRG